MSAFLSACSCLCDASVTRPEQRHRTAASALAWSDRRETAPNPPGALGGMYAAEDTYLAVPCLCLYLSEDPGAVARGTVSEV